MLSACRFGIVCLCIVVVPVVLAGGRLLRTNMQNAMTKTYTWRGLPYSTNRVLGLLGERGKGNFKLLKGFREGVGKLYKDQPTPCVLIRRLLFC